METKLNILPNTKRCKSCGLDKPLDEFSPHKTGKLGRCPRCKICSNAARREQYKNNPEYRERVSERHVARYANDQEYRERILRQTLSWGRKNPEKRREYVQKYRELHPEKVKAMNAKNQVPSSPAYIARLEVNKAIKREEFPPAKSMVCDICQEAQADEYHHWHGYSQEHALDVIAVCKECHGKEHAIWN